MRSSSLKDSFIKSVVSQSDAGFPIRPVKSLTGTETIRIASDLETEVEIDGISNYIRELMEEQVTRVHEEASIDVPSYDANVFKEQVLEETKNIIRVVEMTQTSNDTNNPVKIDMKIIHPPPDGPKATLDSIAYKQRGITPILC